ncbi:hypothetical protein LPA46_10775 [Halobacterium sp. KA-6]|nr:hypothetical protein [Halobacterium sp. KA-6]MCD2203828.1 hypothetical protein [Halobacterium sp. KA-6]
MTDAHHPWRDESLLHELYWKQELSTVKIADELGCTQQTVSKWMQKFDIPRRDPREAAPNRRGARRRDGDPPDDVVDLPDGGRPSPTLPENWRTVSRPDLRVFQRADRDHYIVLGDGSDEWLVVLCSQGDRAYPALLAHRTVAEDADVERVIWELAGESNDLIEPPKGEHWWRRFDWREPPTSSSNVVSRRSRKSGAN